MTIVSRDGASLPVVPKETVPAPSIGGDVVVRGLLLADRLQFTGWQEQRNQPLEGESQEDAYLRAGATAVPELLSKTVLASDGEPLWTFEQWQAFGSKHAGDAMQLFNTAWRLSGFDSEQVAKN